MMKHNLIFLLVLVATVLVGCKPKNIDIDNALKQISEETFAQSPSRSYCISTDNDMFVVEYTFDEKTKTAERKEVNFQQNNLFKGEQVEKFTYTWGEFSDKKFGRTLLLTGETGNRTLSYLNDQLNDGQIVTTVKEPRADMAANMINGLSADGSWNAEDPTYVLQLVWRDSFIVKWVIKKKKLTPDTVPMRIPLARRDTIGVDSCLYYAYTFVNGASSKEAQKATDIKRNIVKADTTYLPKLDDPKKNDTIVKYTVTEGVRVPLSVVDYASWNISGISVKKDVQSMDVVVGEKDKDPETLSMSEYKYNGTTGSFVLNSLTYSFNPKH